MVERVAIDNKMEKIEGPNDQDTVRDKGKHYCNCEGLTIESQPRARDPINNGTPPLKGMDTYSYFEDRFVLGETIEVLYGLYTCNTKKTTTNSLAKNDIIY